MDDSRLVKLREELEKARKKRDDWEAKVKDLERRYNEAEKVYVYGIFQTANMEMSYFRKDIMKRCV